MVQVSSTQYQLIYDHDNVQSYQWYCQTRVKDACVLDETERTSHDRPYSAQKIDHAGLDAGLSLHATIDVLVIWLVVCIVRSLRGCRCPTN
jgi:hypothetical protein